MTLLIGNNKHLADSLERIRIADSVERIAYRKIKDIFFSLLSAIRYPLSAKKSAIRYPLSAKNGFTLLELLIVISIISIILGFSMPIFRKTFSDIKLNAAAQDIVSLLRYAQERSIVEGAIFRLNVDTVNGGYWLTKAKKEEAKSALLFNKVTGNYGRRYSIPDDLAIETAAVDAIDCYPDGEITAAAITLRNPNKKSLSIVTTPNVGSGVAVIENAQP